jgi:signal transduction histidine kinase
MIRRLKIKLTAVITGSLVIIFLVIFVTLNLLMYSDNTRQTEDFLQLIVENDGFFLPPRNDTSHAYHRQNIPDDFRPNVMRAGRFFYVKLDSYGGVIETNTEMMFDFSEENAASLAKSVSGKSYGIGEIDDFIFLKAEKAYGQIIVFAEQTIEMRILERLTNISIIAAGVSCVVLFTLSLILTGWIIAPVKLAFDKQRRFTSDASHELKTPLTIISANVDVMQNEIGDNGRIAHIKTQIARMSKLIQNLLLLSKTEDGEAEAVKSQFNLSSLALNTALEFESLAFENGKQYSYDIAENISIVGDEGRIKELINILIDNALRYSVDSGIIKISLSLANGHPRLSVYNTGNGIAEDEKNKIFDRFYRSDVSRARETGGFGIGLSIAKAIVDAHKGNIKVIGEYGKWVEFAVRL